MELEENFIIMQWSQYYNWIFYSQLTFILYFFLSVYLSIWAYQIVIFHLHLIIFLVVEIQNGI